MKAWTKLIHQTEGEFRATEKAIYKFTPEGMLAGRWNAPGTNTTSGTPNSSKPNLTSVGSESRVPPVPSPSVRPSHASTHESEDPRASISDSVTTPHAGLDRERDHSKDSHTARLKQILDEPALRSLFREFLRSNFCEENLSFWLDVQDFKRRFSTTSSAVAAPGTGGGDGKGKAQKAQGHAAMDKHQGDLIAMAFVIYNSESGSVVLLILVLDLFYQVYPSPYLQSFAWPHPAPLGRADFQPT